MLTTSTHHLRYSPENHATNRRELIYKPLILDINNEFDFSYFKSLHKAAVIIDNVYNQLKELIKSRNPKNKLSEEQYGKCIGEYLKDGPIDKHGVWVYYSWSNKLVHTLTEDEFIELRTIRNCYKITREEQMKLKKKIIGIVGLSAG